jgi:hypothetical protein
VVSDDADGGAAGEALEGQGAEGNLAQSVNGAKADHSVLLHEGDAFLELGNW